MPSALSPRIFAAAALAFGLALSTASSAHARPEVWLSTRASLGLSASTDSQQGLAFAPSLTAGVRVYLPTSPRNAFTIAPDLGVAWTVGHGAGDTTLGSAGVGVGHYWGLTGLSWNPRVLLGVRSDGESVRGLRNGLRVSFVGGLFDFEVAHQVLRSPAGDEQQMHFAVGVDPGFFVHALSRWSGPRPPARLR